MTKLPENIAIIRAKLASEGWFQSGGLWAVVDGQFGSTGKGLASSVLAHAFGLDVDLVTSNAGPNSGHTSYFGDEKVVLKQLPTFAVMAEKIYGVSPLVQMNAGAIIDPAILEQEVEAHGLHSYLMASPYAAVADDDAREFESHLVRAVGSTGKGTGAALARKVMRTPDAVFGSHSWDHRVVGQWRSVQNTASRVFMEVSQGFSLSLNASGMYPFTTSRDCTVMQGMADAGVHPSMYRDCMMVVRTYPIRVAGNSGPCYSDQEETSWEELGQTPELTTVTNKVRRVFTWSTEQYTKALIHNRPSAVFVNFVNYLNGDVDAWVSKNIVEPYEHVMGKAPIVLLGSGPRNEDVQLWDYSA